MIKPRPISPPPQSSVSSRSLPRNPKPTPAATVSTATTVSTAALAAAAEADSKVALEKTPAQTTKGGLSKEPPTAPLTTPAYTAKQQVIQQGHITEHKIRLQANLENKISAALKKSVAEASPLPYSREDIQNNCRRIGNGQGGEVYQVGDRVVKLHFVYDTRLLNKDIDAEMIASLKRQNLDGKPNAEEGEWPQPAAAMWNKIYGDPNFYEGKFASLASAKVILIKSDLPGWENGEEIFTAPFLKSERPRGVIDMQAKREALTQLTKAEVYMGDPKDENFVLMNGAALPIDMGEIYPLDDSPVTRTRRISKG